MYKEESTHIGMSTIDQIIGAVNGADASSASNKGKITGDQDVFIRKLMSSLILSSKSSNSLQRSGMRV